jgi:hypothetical protein
LIHGTVRKLGMSETTLLRWASGKRAPEARDAAPTHLARLVDTFELAVWECLTVAAVKIDEASFHHLMQATAIAAEMMVVLRRSAPRMQTDQTAS